MPEAEKILVMGSNSFSGSHFVDHCLNQGFEVAGVSRSEQPDDVFLPYVSNGSAERFSFRRYDINHQLSELVSFIEDFRPPRVVNFAAQGMVAQSWEKPEDWFRTNTLSTIQLHDALRKLDFLECYLHVSTPEVYGSCSGLVREHTHYNPSTPYAVSRAAADMSLMSFLKAYDFPVVFTRAANVYGPGQQLYRIIPITILNFLSGKKLQLHGGGESVRSFIHIQDVAAATLEASQKGKPGDIFHLSTDRMISIKELVKLIAQMLEVSFEDNVEVTGERLGKDTAYLLDASKAHEELDWKDQISLEDGIRDTIKWVKENFDTLKDLPRKYVHKP